MAGGRAGEGERLKSGFAPGIVEEMTVTTTPPMGTTHLGPSVPPMYSTPSMIQLIEDTCIRLIDAYVEPGEQSVGTRVDVQHLAPTTIGKSVTARVEVREVKGRRYAFNVEVHNEDGVKIGEGAHDRALIDIARFAATYG